MIQRSLDANTDISVIGLGTASMVHADEQLCQAIVHAAINQGVTWMAIDLRAGHESSRLLALAGSLQRFVTVDATALGNQAGLDRLRQWSEPQPWPVLCVSPAADVPMAAVADRLRALAALGVATRLGLCDPTPAMLAWCAAQRLPLQVVQCRYSLCHPSGAAIAAWCAEHAVACLAHTPLEHGLLGGGWDAPTIAARAPKRDATATCAAVTQLRAIAEADERSPAAIAIGAVLCTEGITAVQLGVRSVAQAELLNDTVCILRQNALDQASALFV